MTPQSVVLTFTAPGGFPNGSGSSSLVFSYPIGYFNNGQPPTNNNFTVSSFGVQSLSLVAKQSYTGTGAVTTITLTGMTLGSPQPASLGFGFTVSTNNAFASLPVNAPGIGGEISIVSFEFPGSAVQPGSTASPTMTFQSSIPLFVSQALTLSFPIGFIQSGSIITLSGAQLGTSQITATSFVSGVIFNGLPAIPSGPNGTTVTVTLTGCQMSQQPMLAQLTLSSISNYGIPSAPISVGIPIIGPSMTATVSTGSFVTISIAFQFSQLLPASSNTVTLSYPNAFFSSSFNSFSCCEILNNLIFTTQQFPPVGLNSIVFSVQTTAVVSSFAIVFNATLGPGKFGPDVNFTLSTSISPPVTVTLNLASVMPPANQLLGAPTFIISDNDRMPGATSVTVKSQFTVPLSAPSSVISFNFPVAFLSPPSQGSNVGFSIILTANGNSVPAFPTSFTSSYLQIQSQFPFFGNISVVLLGCTLGAATQGSSTGIVISGDNFYWTGGISSGSIGPVFTSVSAAYAVGPASQPPLSISFVSTSPMPAGSTVTLLLYCGGLPCLNIQDVALNPPIVTFNVGQRVTAILLYINSGNSLSFVQPVGFLVTNQNAQFQDLFIQGSMNPATSLMGIQMTVSATTGLGNISLGAHLSFGSSCLSRTEISDPILSSTAIASSNFKALTSNSFFYNSMQQPFPWTYALSDLDVVIGETVAVMFEWTALAAPTTISVNVPTVSSGRYMSFPSNPACFFSNDANVMQLTCNASNPSVLVCINTNVQPSGNWQSFQFGCQGVTISQMPFKPNSQSPSISITFGDGFPLNIPLPPIFPLSLTVSPVSLSPSFIASLEVIFPSAFNSTWTLTAISMLSSVFATNSSYALTAAVANPNNAPPSSNLYNQVTNLSVAALSGPTQPATYLFGQDGFYLSSQALPLGNAWASVVLVVPPTGKPFLQDCRANTLLCTLNLNSSMPPLQAPGCLPPASALSVSDAPVVVSAYSKDSSAPSASSDTHGNSRKLLQTSGPGQANAFSYVANVEGASLTSGSLVSNFTASLYNVPPPPSCIPPCYSLSLTSLIQLPWCNFQNFTSNLQTNPNVTGFTCVGDRCAASTCIVDPFLCQFCTVVSNDKQFNDQTAQCCDPPALGASASCALCINPVDGRALPGNAPPPPVYKTSNGPQTCTNPSFVTQFKTPAGLPAPLDVSNLGFTPLPSVKPGAALPFASFESCVSGVQAAFNSRNYQVQCPNEGANIQFLQYPFNTMTPSVLLDGLDGTIKNSCSGSVCSTTPALVSCNVIFPTLNFQYEGFPYYFTPVYSATVNNKPLIIRARLPWTSVQITSALNLVGLPHSAEQICSPYKTYPPYSCSFNTTFAIQANPLASYTLAVALLPSLFDPFLLFCGFAIPYALNKFYPQKFGRDKRRNTTISSKLAAVGLTYAEEMQKVGSDEADSTAVQQRLLQLESRMNAKIEALDQELEKLSSLRANPGSTGAGPADTSVKPAWLEAHERASVSLAKSLELDVATDRKGSAAEYNH